MDVALAIDAPYLPWCAVAIRSLLDYGGEHLTIHLFHEGSLSGHPGVERLAAMVDDAGALLRVRAIDADMVASLPGPGLTRLGTLVWLRCLLAELLSDLERVLYMDADTMVVSPVEPLFATDVGDAPVAAVANIVPPSERARLKALGIEDHRRFLNAGILLFDLQQLRAEDASRTLMRVAASRGTELRWADQDALNVVFAGRWHVLHPRWNAQNTLWSSPDVAAEVLGDEASREARLSPAILHFEGPSLCKPWHALNTHPWRDAWWATLERTPWADTSPEDRGPATAALRLLPERARVWTYSRLIGWRARRSVAQ